MESLKKSSSITKGASNQIFPRQLYDDLVKDLIGSSEAWLIWKQLNSLDEEGEYLLLWAASGFFLTVRRTLIHSVIVGIGRLLDQDSRNKTIGRFLFELETLADSDEKLEASKLLLADFRSFVRRANQVVTLRHNFIAHSAAKPTLTTLQILEVDEYFKSLWSFLDRGLLLFTGYSQQGIEHIVIDGGADSLLSRLKQLPTWEEELSQRRQSRMERPW